MKEEFVTAAAIVSRQPAVYGTRSRTKRDILVECRSSGAWFSEKVGNHWVTSFAGSHQNVPFGTMGRTAGRSLRAMRRKLEREKIPAVQY